MSFRHTLRVRWFECDPQGVIGHPRYLDLFDVAMTEFWREAVDDYTALAEMGFDFAVIESRVRYISPARFDELLDIDVEVVRMGTTSLVMSFHASVEGKAVAEGENSYVCIAVGTHQKAPLPDAIRSALAGHQAAA